MKNIFYEKSTGPSAPNGNLYDYLSMLRHEQFALSCRVDALERACVLCFGLTVLVVLTLALVVLLRPL